MTIISNLSLSIIRLPFYVDEESGDPCCIGGLCRTSPPHPSTQKCGCVLHEGGDLPPLFVQRNAMVLCRKQEWGMSAVSRSRHVCCAIQQTQQTCPYHRADMSTVSHSRHVCCVTQQTFLLSLTADPPQHSNYLLFGLPRTTNGNLQRTLISIHLLIMNRPSLGTFRVVCVLMDSCLFSGG